MVFKQIYKSIFIINIFCFLNLICSDGQLDNSFNGGVFTTPIATSTGSAAEAIAIQADGKIVAAGHAIVNNNTQFALARYATDGQLDTSFGIDGTVTNQIPGYSYSTIKSIAIQPDGKIVAVGYVIYGQKRAIAIARYNTNGTLDTTFNGGAFAIIPQDSYTSAAYSVAIQADGKIIVAGSAAYVASGIEYFHIAILRYNPNGELDTDFGVNGIVSYLTEQQFLQINAVAIQADGNIVVAGQGSIGAETQFLLARFTTTGDLDESFNTGIITNQFPGSNTSIALALAIQADGKIVAGGATLINNFSHFALARYTTTGELDISFNGTGMVVTDAAGALDSNIFAIAIQSDSKIVAVGRAYTGLFYQMALARYNTDGSIDKTFNGGSFTTEIVDAISEAHAVAIQADGKIVTAGSAAAFQSIFAMARYISSPALNPTTISYYYGDIISGTSQYLSTITVYLTNQAGIVSEFYATPVLSSGTQGNYTIQLPTLPAGKYTAQAIARYYNGGHVSIASSIIEINTCPGIIITPASLPSGIVGREYNQQITATGGAGSYTFSINNGILPAGMILSASGLLSGTPLESYNSNITITATDGLGCAQDQSYLLKIGLQYNNYAQISVCDGILLTPNIPSSTVGLLSYKWLSNNPKFVDPKTPSLTVYPKESTQYQLIITDGSGNIFKSAVFTVNVGFDCVCASNQSPISCAIQNKYDNLYYYINNSAFASPLSKALRGTLFKQLLDTSKPAFNMNYTIL